MKEKDRFNPEDLLSRNVRLTNMQEAEDFLYSVLPDSPKALFKDGEGLNRSRYFMHELGDPQDQVRAVHIAGTSGKGSTAYYLSGILVSHGFNVGTHVSPHMYDMRERAMINLKNPPEVDFLRGINDTIPLIKRMDGLASGRPTYFEVTVANAFLLFASKQVDYAVVETGLGGRYDSTNTITRSDKLAVITQIGLDHTDVLGDTVEKIAYQKAGIIPFKGNSLVLQQDKSVNSVMENVARERSSEVSFVDTSGFAANVRLGLDGVNFDYKDEHFSVKDCNLQTIASYQVENAALAIKTAAYLAQRDGFELDEGKVKDGLASVLVPGRSEVLQYEGVTLLLDGAHNPQKMEAFIKSLHSLELKQPPIWLVGVKNGKDTEALIAQIISEAGEVHFTQFFNDAKSNRLKKFAVPATRLKSIADSLSGTVTSRAHINPRNALTAALKSAKGERLIVVSGSIYLLSEINQIIE